MKRAQVSIEFILLTILGFAFVFIILSIVLTLSADKSNQQVFDQFEDLGRSLQQEFLLASTLHDGYIRDFWVPDAIGGIPYNVVFGNTSEVNGYMILSFQQHELFYSLPVVSGTLVLGTNTLRKEHNRLYLN